jgi:hypothetical protein
LLEIKTSKREGSYTRSCVDVLLYDDHDRALKLLHALDRTVWEGKVEAILESEKYTTLTVNELFSKLKSAEVDRGLTTHLESPYDSHSLALVGGKVTKSNANASSRMLFVFFDVFARQGV